MLMVDKGLKGRAAAKEIGISYPTLYRLSNYKKPHPPDIETFHKCVLWLGVDYKDFFIIT